MKRVLIALLCLVLALSFVACGTQPKETSSEKPAENATAPAEEKEEAPADSDEVFTVITQFSMPEWNAAPMVEVLDLIAEESDGRLEFEYYYNNALYASADIVGAFQEGNLHLANFMTSAAPGLFPLNSTLFSLPFMGYPDMTAATEIYQDLVKNNEHMAAEFTSAGIVRLASWCIAPYNLYFVEEETVIEPDFTGKTIITDVAYLQQFINEHGGAAMTAFPPDYYSNLNNGVCEGIINHLSVLNAFSCIELFKSGTTIGDGGVVMAPNNVGMSQVFWDSLPADLQDLFLKHADEIAQAGFNFDFNAVEEVTQMLTDNGANIVKLNEEELVVWQEAFAGVRETALKDVCAINPAGEEVYQLIQEKIAAY